MLAKKRLQLNLREEVEVVEKKGQSAETLLYQKYKAPWRQVLMPALRRPPSSWEKVDLFGIAGIVGTSKDRAPQFILTTRSSSSGSTF